MTELQWTLWGGTRPAKVLAEVKQQYTRSNNRLVALHNMIADEVIEEWAAIVDGLSKDYPAQAVMLADVRRRMIELADLFRQYDYESDQTARFELKEHAVATARAFRGAISDTGLPIAKCDVLDAKIDYLLLALDAKIRNVARIASHIEQEFEYVKCALYCGGAMQATRIAEQLKRYIQLEDAPQHG